MAHGGVAHTLQAQQQDEVLAQMGMGDLRQQSGVSFATNHTHALSDTKLAPGQRYSAKIPPVWSGAESFYEYERDVKNWCNISSTDPRQRGAALREKIVGTQVYLKEHLENHMVNSGRQFKEEEKTPEEIQKLNNDPIALKKKNS